MDGRVTTLIHRLREGRGQAMIEFVIVAPVLLLLVLGGIDFGIVYSNIIGMRQGVSAGAREAAIGQFGTNSTCTLTGASGFSTDDKELACLTHSLDGINNDATTRVDIIVGNTGSATYAVGSQVTICEEYAPSSASGYLSRFLTGHVATGSVTDEVQTLNSSGLASASETALAGSTWSFCATPAPA